MCMRNGKTRDGIRFAIQCALALSRSTRANYADITNLQFQSGAVLTLKRAAADATCDRCERQIHLAQTLDQSERCRILFDLPVHINGRNRDSIPHLFVNRDERESSEGVNCARIYSKHRRQSNKRRNWMEHESEEENCNSLGATFIGINCNKIHRTWKRYRVRFRNSVRVFANKFSIILFARYIFECRNWLLLLIRNPKAVDLYAPVGIRGILFTK